MEYAIRQHTAKVQAIMFDGTRDGIEAINRFLVANEQHSAIATPLATGTDDEGKERLYCYVGYMDTQNPVYHFMSPFDYFILREDGTRFIIPKSVFEEIYQPKELNVACTTTS